MTRLTLRRGRERRARSGHPWIFSNEIETLKDIHTPGAAVDVFSSTGDYLGTGYANPHSLIAVRLLTRRRGESIDDSAFFIRRIRAALDYRKTICGDLTALRLVHGEADGLSGLVVDRYDDVLVVQLSTLGMDFRQQLIVEALVELLQPRAIIARNDLQVRGLEGLPSNIEQLYGEFPADQPRVDINGLQFRVDVMEGQKTGLFLDQRENCRALESLAAGRSALDLFCYAGAWGLHAAAYDARKVLGVDVSAQAVATASANAQANGLAGVCSYQAADGFAFLSDAVKQSERYGLVILDPPAFIKSRKHLAEGRKGYLTVNRRAFELVEPGGFLVTCSCSYHMDRNTFLGIIAQAANQARRNVRLLEMRGQAADHPILPACPETDYLKCAILHVE